MPLLLMHQLFRYFGSDQLQAKHITFAVEMIVLEDLVYSEEEANILDEDQGGAQYILNAFLKRVALDVTTKCKQGVLNIGNMQDAESLLCSLKNTCEAIAKRAKPPLFHTPKLPIILSTQATCFSVAEWKRVKNSRVSPPAVATEISNNSNHLSNLLKNKSIPKPSEQKSWINVLELIFACRDKCEALFAFARPHDHTNLKVIHYPLTLVIANIYLHCAVYNYRFYLERRQP